MRAVSALAGEAVPIIALIESSHRLAEARAIDDFSVNQSGERPPYDMQNRLLNKTRKRSLSVNRSCFLDVSLRLKG